MNAPTVRVPVLALNLMNLNSRAMAIGKLGTLPQVIDILDLNGLGTPQEYIEEMTDCPGALVSVAELVGFSSWTRTHVNLPSRTRASR